MNERIFFKNFWHGENIDVAYLGWEDHVEPPFPYTNYRQIIYISGYLEAARKIAVDVKNDENLIYPVTFLYRQYIELVLKNINSQLKKPISLKGQKAHDMKYIFDSIYDQLINRWFFEQQELDHIRNVINEFANIDPKSSYFRYYEKIGDKGYEKTINEKMTVNVSELIKSMDEFDDILSVTYKILKGK